MVSSQPFIVHQLLLLSPRTPKIPKFLKSSRKSQSHTKVDEETLRKKDRKSRPLNSSILALVYLIFKITQGDLHLQRSATSITPRRQHISSMAHGAMLSHVSTASKSLLVLLLFLSTFGTPQASLLVLPLSLSSFFALGLALKILGLEKERG